MVGLAAEPWMVGLAAERWMVGLAAEPWMVDLAAEPLKRFESPLFSLSLDTASMG